MRRLVIACCLFSILRVASAQSASAQAAGRVVMTIRGVGVGSTPNQVQKALGNPRAKKTENDEMVGSILTFHYDGMDIEFTKDSDKKFTATDFVVLSRRWSVSPGIRVGMTRSQMLKKLGNPESEPNRESDRGTVLYQFWAGNDEYSACRLKRGKIIEIHFFIDLS